MKKIIYIVTAILIIIVVLKLDSKIDLSDVDKSDVPTVFVGDTQSDFYQTNPEYMEGRINDFSYIGKDGFLELYSVGKIAYDSKSKCYNAMFLINRSSVDIDSTFSMTIDMKYKDEYLFKNAHFIYDIDKYDTLPSMSNTIIYVEVTPEEFENIGNDSFSKEYTTIIKDFQYEKDIKWNPKHLNNNYK